MADFTKVSPFNKEANFSKIKFGADAPLLETELNEMQDIQNSLLEEVTKLTLPNGISDLTKANISGNVLSINNCKIIVDGIILNVTSPLKITLSNGDKAYIEVLEKEVTHLDTLNKEGNEQSTQTVTNLIKDSRVGVETSRRFQRVFNLVKVKPLTNKFLEVGTMVNGKFTFSLLNYNTAHRVQDLKNNKVYICFEQLSKEGKPQIIYKEEL